MSFSFVCLFVSLVESILSNRKKTETALSKLISPLIKREQRRESQTKIQKAMRPKTRNTKQEKQF
jgi:hypothetical protein